MDEHVNEVIGDENVTSANNADQLKYELAATSLAILDKEDERRSFNKDINEEITKLKKRQRELAQTIKSGGIQLAMNFGTVASDNAVTPPPKKRGRKPHAEMVS